MFYVNKDAELTVELLPRFDIVIEGDEERQVETHLYAKTLFIGVGDSIENYIEVPAPVVAE